MKKRYTDISIDALGDFLTRQPRGDAIRVEQGIEPETKVLDAVYLPAERLVRLYLDCEAEPWLITRIVIEPIYKSLVRAGNVVNAGAEPAS